MIGTVLIEPVWTLPIAMLIVAGVIWYFLRLGRDDVPPSRRRVRRLSLVAALATLPMLVWVLSFIRPEQQPGLFIALWSIVFVLILIIVALALLDMVNNLRLHHETVQAELHEAAAELAEAMRKRRERQQSDKGESADERG